MIEWFNQHKSAQIPAKLWLVSVILTLCVYFFPLQYFLLSQINVQNTVLSNFPENCKHFGA